MQYSSTLGLLSPHELAPPTLQQSAAEALFGDTRFRPDARTMESLINLGLTEDTILAAGETMGYARPVMELTLKDLDTALPYVQAMSDRLADEHHGDNILFAGRDAEVLYDDFAITHPGLTAHLLPASTDLWNSVGMTRLDGLSSQFLSNFGFNADAVRNPRNKHVVVDSGFRGSIGEYLNERLRGLYNVSLLGVGALCVKLVCASSDALGPRIMDFSDSERLLNDDLLPKTKRWVNPDDIRAYNQVMNYGLAASIQLMPRFHDSFADLDRLGDRVVALPDVACTSGDNVDRPQRDQDLGFHNASVINPVAAAVVQYRVVKAAMARSHRGWGVDSRYSVSGLGYYTAK